MTAMMEERAELKRGAGDVLGWRVSVSQPVWDRCVSLPEGADGQTLEGRLHDLLGFLGFYLRELAAPRQGRISSGFGFSVNVVNGGRRRRDYPDGLECPGEEVPVAVFASFGEDGTPNLAVVLQSEVASLTTGHAER